MLRAMIEDAIELSCLVVFLCGLGTLAQPGVAGWLV
jgi:hypothetical protein